MFEFAVARGFAVDNPVKAMRAVKADKFAIQIFTPTEMRKLLGAASNEFLPSIVLGAFAGLRRAEIKWLSWDDIRLAERHIVVGKDKAKTASRRIVPVWENCATWLAPYAGHAGAVWGGGYSQFYDEQKNAQPKKQGSPGSATGYATAMPAIALPRQWTPDAWRVNWVTAPSSFIDTTASWLLRKRGKNRLPSSRTGK